MPTAFNASTTAGSLGNDDAGKYALKLAALAKLGEGQAAPSLAVMEALAADLADGDIDGKNGADASVNAPYSNFGTELGAKMSALATSHGSADLKNALSGFQAIASTIDFSAIVAGSGGGNSGASSLSCDTSLFQSGAAVATPTGIELIAFAGAYTGAEATFDNQFVFTKTGNAFLTIRPAGAVTYNGAGYVTTSACVDTLTGGGKQLVLNFAKGHFDISDNHQSISGVSPADGEKIIQPSAASTAGTTTGGTSSNVAGVKIPSGHTVAGPLAFSAIPNVVGGNIGHATTDTAKLTVYDYVTTLAVTATDSATPVLSTILNAGLNSCALVAEAVDSSHPACSSLGIMFDRSAGRITFAATPMKAVVFSCPTDCTLNGSVSFAPY